jgi:hypothetical protein
MRGPDILKERKKEEESVGVEGGKKGNASRMG